MLSPNTKAPDFTLLDEKGVSHTLSTYLGKWVLLYFYPKDDTPGCTKEACMLRDVWPDFGSLNAAVFGVSADSVKSHKKFAEKYGLPFTLLSDESKDMLKAYGVWGIKKMMGREYEGISRTSFLIAPDGTITKIYESVKPELHAVQVLEDLKAYA